MSRFTRCVVACIVLLPFDPAVNAQPPRTDALGDPLPPFAVARLGTTTRLGHASSITALAFAPDGKMLAAADYNSVRLWDTATGKLLRQLRQNNLGHLMAVAFSPDGKWLAVGGQHGLTVCDAATSKHRTTLKATHSEIRTLHFSPNGRTLVVGTGTAVTAFDVATGKHLLSPEDKLGFKLIAAAAPDDKAILGLSDDNMLSRWRLSDGKLLQRWCPTEFEWINVAALSADGKKLALGYEGGTLFVCDATTGKKYPALAKPPAQVNILSFSHDGEFLVAVSKTHWYVWRVATGQRLHARSLGFEESPPVAVAPGNGILAYAGFKQVGLFDLVTNSERFSESPLYRPVWGVFFTTHKGQCVAATWQRSSSGFAMRAEMRFWDAATGRLVAQLSGHDPSVNQVAVRFKGEQVAFLDFDETLSLWNVVTGKPITPLKGKIKGFPKSVLQMAFSPDGTRFAALSQSRTNDSKPRVSVSVWETAEWKEVGALELIEASARMAFAPDSKTLVFIGDKEKLLFWNPATGRQRDVSVVGLSRVQQILWSPDGRLLAVARPEQFNWVNVFVYEVATGERVSNYKAQVQSWIDLAFAHDCRTLFGGNGCEVVVWDAVTGKERGRLTGHEDALTSLALSAEGRRLLSGSADHTALVWDVPAFLAAMHTPAQKLTAAELQACWADLAKFDAAVAYRAVDNLVAALAQSVPWLAKQLLPVQSQEGKPLAKLLSELDDKKFAVRQQAQAALQKYGEALVPILEQKLWQPTSLEMRRRLEKLLEQVTPATPGPETLRAIRIVAVLEYVGTPGACKLLAALAEGVPEARLTLEAQAALRRLAAPRP